MCADSEAWKDGMSSQYEMETKEIISNKIGEGRVGEHATVDCTQGEELGSQKLPSKTVTMSTYTTQLSKSITPFSTLLSSIGKASKTPRSVAYSVPGQDTWDFGTTGSLGTKRLNIRECKLIY